MSNRLAITILIGGIVASVLFGIGATAVLSIPQLASNAAILLPAVIVLSFLIAPIFSWALAPTMRARYVRQEARRDSRSVDT